MAIPAEPIVFKFCMKGLVTFIPSAPASPVAKAMAKKTPPITTAGRKYETPVLNAFTKSF